VSASADNTAKVWDVEGKKELKVLKGHDQAVTAVTFVGDDDTIVTSSLDRTIRVWSVKAVKEVAPAKMEEKKEPKKEEKKDVKPKDKKDKKDKKDEKKPEEKKEEPKLDPKDAGEIKRLGPTRDDPYALVWDQKTKTLAVCGYSGEVTTWALD